jgi:hypothetical protein
MFLFQISRVPSSVVDISESQSTREAKWFYEKEGTKSPGSSMILGKFPKLLTALT